MVVRVAKQCGIAFSPGFLIGVGHRQTPVLIICEVYSLPPRWRGVVANEEPNQHRPTFRPDED